ncbi:MAG: type IV pilus secretin PilQ [Candidatus Acidiferrales bacterium]
MKFEWRMCRLALLLAACLNLTSLGAWAQTSSDVRVNAEVKESMVRLEARAAHPFEYTTYRPSESLFVVDMTGLSTPDSSIARVLDSDLVSSYRLLNLNAGSKPVVRLEVLLHSPLEPHVERTSTDELSITFVGAGKTHSAITPASQPTLHPAPVNSASTSSAVRQVSLVQNGANTEVVVKGDGRLNVHTERLKDPDRLVLDFQGARLATPEKDLPSNLDPVRKIRMSQFAPSVARVVIDLRGEAAFDVHSSANEITVEFKPDHVRSRDAKPSAEGHEQKSVKVDTAAQPAVQQKLPAQPRLATPGSGQPATSLTQSYQPATGTVLATPEKQESAPVSVPATVMVLTPDGKNATEPKSAESATEHKVTGSGASSTATPALEEGKYTGEPISVNLKDVDLKDFFRLIHEISGLNVVLDPNVKGTLTIVLDDVPWDQALDIVLQNNDLDKQLQGNVLRIATKETLKREADQARDLAKAQLESVPVVTTTRVLSYAKADDITKTLKAFLSPRGDMIADNRSNTLIIRDIPDVIPVIDNLLRQLDRKSQQVEIEARVVAANRSFSRDIGTQFAFATSAVGGKNIFGGNPNVGANPTVNTGSPTPPGGTSTPPLVTGPGPINTGTTPVTNPLNLPLNTNLGALAPTSGIAYQFTSPNFALDFIISAAEAKGVGKLLSKPRVATQNNTKATVKQGTKIPIQTVVNNTISVQYIDAVLELDVTPQITAEGTVFMDVHVENTQIDNSIPRVNNIPALDTQAADTKITVNDGTTVVVGGIIVTNQQTAISQVPLFGSIPLIGNLFKHTTVSSNSQELLFFLTPRILPG